MATTTAAITIEEDVRLDLGHTDLVGNLVFDGEALVLVAPSGAIRQLGHRLYTGASGEVTEAREGHVFIEEMGLFSTLPAELVKTGHILGMHRHQGISAWGADVIEMLVLLPGGPATEL